MIYDNLIPAPALAAALDAASSRLLVCDCRFDLAQPDAGQATFAGGHIPGAVYLHLDQHLSGAKSGRNGRHPLPDADTFTAHLAALGADDDTQFVLYDASGGMYAARAWWLLRWVGHQAAAVLDGGVAAWLAAGQALTAAPTAARTPGGFRRRASLARTLDFAALKTQVGSVPLVDARAPDRFRGENETLDPVGGHIPGARNRFFKDNLGADGRFKPSAQLRQEWLAVLGGDAPETVVHQCGSGVTACHNLLAMEAAGLIGSQLYPGSWSEWCAQPGAPMASGE
jgi:thiosulfate/3-mercaptopyruvate sulfurtransferase